jgi:hypothetical protein
MSDMLMACGGLTLALARFRQGRPAEAQRLCREVLRADLDPDDRATTLAIVALSRHATGLDGRPHVAEALTLDPKAMMVPEAARVVGTSPPTTNPGWARPGPDIPIDSRMLG